MKKDSGRKNGKWQILKTESIRPVMKRMAANTSLEILEQVSIFTCGLQNAGRPSIRACSTACDHLRVNESFKASFSSFAKGDVTTATVLKIIVRFQCVRAYKRFPSMPGKQKSTITHLRPHTLPFKMV